MIEMQHIFMVFSLHLFLQLSQIVSIFSYLVVFDCHILPAQFKDGLPGSHIQCILLLTQQQRGVVEDVRFRKLHQI